jgi:trehalose 6-phosphate synthase/phosphatase
LPFVLKNEGNTWQRKPSAGGLVTAVAPIVIESKGMWVGWPGVDMKHGEAIPESASNDKSPTSGLRSDHIVPVSLNKDDHELYYNGMCNATLWPLFHSMSDRAVIDPRFFKAYKRINEDFAIKTVDALAKMSSASPEKHCIVWIHDYHLLLAANRIREIASERELNCLLAFFLHIPWPAYDIFRIMPWSKQLLEGVLGCDVIGFHDDDYCVNFLDCCNRLMGYLVEKNDKGEMLVEKNDGRVVSVKEMPISIPYQKFKDMALNSKPGTVKEGVRTILGVDRLDYTKGIPNKLRAYKELLDDFPEHREKVRTRFKILEK